MKSNLMPQDPDASIALAEEIAELAGELMSIVGQEAQHEPLIRASVAAAVFVRRAVVPARNRRDHGEEQLRRRLAAALAQICLLLDNEDLSQVTDYVLSITA